MEKLPSNISRYKQTEIFDECSIPKGLLQDHQTKAGVWGEIIVLEGKLLYTIQSQPPEEIILSPDYCGVVAPEVLHNVKPLGPVRFCVYFNK
ncbi:DUF1971 domain-containing protein [Bacteriovorax sp. Seq25_V]|uniref:DUF1971 domain-containing protein n=1 Tax=Bacteriovorax sp. Seq25_V TaxID=1201288 RepID=UPI00038A15D9|nr:DUF1971 domain-containing protein [Bacteriovorax sp. Seq25_V]EQC47279.1 PF09313 domain protein [Bacteriovorax sp. Seq25_V]